MPSFAGAGAGLWVPDGPPVLTWQDTWPLGSLLRPRILINNESGYLAGSQSILTSAITPRTSTVFVVVHENLVGGPPTITSMEGLGATWVDVGSKTQSNDRLNVWVGTGCSNTGPVKISFSGSPNNVQISIIEWTGGLDQLNPFVVTNTVAISTTAVRTFSTTPNAFENALNSYVVWVWHNATEAIDPLNNNAIEILDPVSANSAEINYTPGNAGVMGGLWASAVNTILVGTELRYDPASVPPPSIWPRPPQSFPDVLMSPVGLLGPPILVAQDNRLATSPSTGNQFTQALDIAATFTVALVKQVNKVFNLPATFTVALVKQVNKLLAITGTFTVALAKQLQKTVLAIASTFTVALVKQVNKPFAIGATFTVALVRQAGKALAIGATFTVALVRRVNKVFALGGTFTVALAKQVGKPLAIGATFTVGLATAKVKVLALAITSTFTVAVSRVVGKALSPPVTFTVSLAKQIGKALALPVTFFVATAKQLPGRIFGISSSFTVGLVVEKTTTARSEPAVIRSGSYGVGRNRGGRPHYPNESTIRRLG
jgi:hypothetical protein